MRRPWCVLVFMALSTFIAAAAVPNLLDMTDPAGIVETYDTAGAIDTSNPFFQSLGTNGRSCGTCHLLGDGMGLSAASAQTLFTSSNGAAPLFADVDGANCSGVSPTDAAAHSLLTGHGLIRVALPFPASPEFQVDTVYDPYGCADTIDGATGQRMLSQYRRPLPSTNLQFLSAVMFDGRETLAPLNNAGTFRANLVTNLTHQALDATLGHAQAAVSPNSQQLSAIVNFELALFTAQSRDNTAGQLNTQGASGGPARVSTQPYYPGINDSLGSNPTGAPFNPTAFTVFAPWATLPGSGSHTSQNDAREQIAAGEEIFNTFPLSITAVGGLNDALHKTTIPGTCTTCHDTPNIGNHSLPVPLDIGVAHSTTYESNTTIDAGLAQLSMPDLPIFKVTCTANPQNTIYMTDLGKALISGKCADLIRVKGPILRGLAARAPYFHNGAAATLREVVEFYDQRFAMGLTDVQKQQLEAFLRSL
jgi:cytochrome c peroxidase